MFNKDEYNQEEYNEYYQQEIRGAELKGTIGEEKKSKGKLLLSLLLLLLLAVAGYFGYKFMNNKALNDSDDDLKVTLDTLPKSVQTKESVEEKAKIVNSDINIKEKEVKKEKTTDKVESEEIAVKEVDNRSSSSTTESDVLMKEVSTILNNNEEESVVKELEKVVSSSSNNKISPEEIASIVTAVMQEINKAKASSTQESNTIVETKDEELVDTLSNLDVDSISNDLIKELENINVNEETHIDNTSNKKNDVYNKVNVQNSTNNDALSELSNQINSIIQEDTIVEARTTGYTQNITKEVSTRQNEMRIIVVKKGDTLGKLAQRAYGNVMDYKKIYQANPELTRPDKIYVGQKLRIPN